MNPKGLEDVSYALSKYMSDVGINLIEKTHQLKDIYMEIQLIILKL